MSLELTGDLVEQPTEAQLRRLPPGQRLTDGWPVLHYSEIPRIDLATWKFHIGGLVERDLTLSWDQFMALPQGAGAQRYSLRHHLEQVRQ